MKRMYSACHSELTQSFKNNIISSYTMGQWVTMILIGCSVQDQWSDIFSSVQLFLIDGNEIPTIKMSIDSSWNRCKKSHRTIVNDTKWVYLTCYFNKKCYIFHIVFCTVFSTSWYAPNIVPIIFYNISIILFAPTPFMTSLRTRMVFSCCMSAGFFPPSFYIG